MPRIEGTIPRKVLPVFNIVQHLGDERDSVYQAILNGLLGKYLDINEKNADVEVRVYFLNFDSEGIFATNSLVNIVSSVDDISLVKKDDTEGTFGNVSNILSEELSAKGCLSSEVGYYEPIIYFFVDDIEIDADVLNKIKAENTWFHRATKLAVSFSDFSDKYKELLGTREAVFVVSRDFDEDKKAVNEFVDLIYDIRINSITHSIQTNFSQTGDICAAIFRGAIDEADEYSDTLYNFPKKQQQFKTLVVVDPIEANDEDEGEPIILTGALLNPYEAEECVVEPICSSEIAEGSESQNNEDWASGSWDD